MKQIILFFFSLLPVCAFSQLSEPFNGPEINSANPWVQEPKEFFLKDGQLFFDASGRSKDVRYIRVPITYAINMEWEFDVSLSFNSSNNNHARVYVYATDAPSDMLFFVQIGHNDDNVSMYLQKGTANPVILIKGRKDLLDSEDVSLRVRLTKENDSQWTLYTRMKGRDYYEKEGTAKVVLSDIRQGGTLNLACVYKASSMKGMLTAFDNVKVSHNLTQTPTDPEGPTDPGTEEPQPPVEVILPELIGMEFLDATGLRFTFDKPVEISTAVISISGIGNAERKSYADESREIVNTRFPIEMKVGNEYTISFKGLFDLSGNQIPDFSRKMKLEEVRPEIPNVLINEVMADPKGVKGLPETEYVELYNASGHPASLDGWYFSYGGSPKTMGKVDIPAGGYAVLFRAGRDIEVDPTGVAVPLGDFPSALANTGKVLQLLDESGELMDEVAYAKAKPGVSWERSGQNWSLSIDGRGGTPGSRNSGGEPGNPDGPDEPDEPDGPDEPGTPDPPIDPSEPGSPDVQPGEIVFNELLPNPYTGGSEYIELYNRSGRSLSLVDLAVAVRKSDGTLNTRYSLSSIIKPISAEGYALLTKSKEGVSSFYLASVPEALHEVDKLPALANTSSTLVLFRLKDEIVIDEVSYSSKWHATSVKDEKGVALERLNPDVETQNPANWASASATAGYGTPGYKNSQYKGGNPGGTTGIEPPVLVDGTDSYTIVYCLDKAGYHCRAFVFDISGRRMAEIANHELMGTEGVLTWNGLSTGGHRLPTGVYLFYAELYHTDGKVKAYKSAFLVR